MKISFLLYLWLVCFSFTGLSFAQELDTGRKELQRLFITERASSQQEKGEWQFNGDFEYRRDSSEDFSRYRIPIAVEYGIRDRLELELGIPYVWQKMSDGDADSIGNLNGGLTFLLLKGNEKIPYIAIGIEIGFPIVREDQDIADEEEKYNHEGFINLTKYFYSFITDINLAYSQSGNGEKEEELEYNLGADFLLNRIFKNADLEGWHFITEFNGERNIDKNANKFYLTPGLKYVTKGGLELGLGVPVGLVAEADDYRIIGSLTYEWGG